MSKEDQNTRTLQNRRNETDTVIPERKKRIFKKEDGYFYYLTREGFDMGPFDNEELAITSINEYINFVEAMGDEQLKAISDSFLIEKRQDS